MSGQILGEPSASASTPGYAFASDSDTGVGHPGANELSLVTGGVTRLTADSAGSISVPGSMSVNGTLTINNGEDVQNLMPSGAVQFFARNTAPAGWMKANGATISRTTYAALFAAIGTTFGAGDGSTTFKIPDLRGEFPRGWDDSRGVDSGRSFGTAQTQDYQSHAHSGTTLGGGSHNHTGSTTGAGAHAHNLSGGNVSGSSVVSIGGASVTRNYPTDGVGDHSHGLYVDWAADHAHSFTTGASGSTETRPRNIALLACIKY
jgi:microcystin-dependent protein